MKFLVVVVTYKSRDLAGSLGALLSDILTADESAHVVTVENSQDLHVGRTLAMLTSSSASRFLHLDADVNEGFAPAVNLGFDAATRRWGPMEAVVLLNPDIIADGTVISTLIQALNEDSSLGIVSTRLVDELGRVDRGCARRRWTLLTLWAEAAGMGLALNRAGGASRYMPMSDAPTAVDITSGALMAVRGDLFGRGLDTRLPMYLEDQEICHRAHEKGFRVVVLPHPSVLHLGGVSRSRNTESQRNLRCMELAAAPVQSLMDWSGTRPLTARLMVGAGGATRVLVAATSLLRPSKRAWSRDQVKLGYWLLRWSISPQQWGQRL